MRWVGGRKEKVWCWGSRGCRAPNEIRMNGWGTRKADINGPPHRGGQENGRARECARRGFIKGQTRGRDRIVIAIIIIVIIIHHNNHDHRRRCLV